jgi:hypothetical protein
MQASPAVLAMNGVDVVYEQAAIGALEAYLVGAEDRLKQPQEQPDERLLFSI